MFVLWEKLKRLQPILRRLSKPILCFHQDIIKARATLLQALQELLNDRMNCQKIMAINTYTEDLVRLNEIEENVLRKKYKIEWLKLGDGNNSYIHASLKIKYKVKCINLLHIDDGDVVTSQQDIEDVVLNYYGELVGHRTNNLTHIDVSDTRECSHLNTNQRANLIAHIGDHEILYALHGMGDMKSHDINGFRARFFKSSWQTIKSNVIVAVQNFFQHERFYKAVNCTVLTLIPKFEGPTSIKDYRPIVGCTTMYKIISRILTTTLSKFVGSIVSLC